MGKNQRQDEILKFVDRAGTVTVAEIMETMKVSDMTVRRDYRVRKPRKAYASIWWGEE